MKLLNKSTYYTISNSFTTMCYPLNSQFITDLKFIKFSKSQIPISHRSSHNLSFIFPH